MAIINALSQANIYVVVCILFFLGGLMVYNTKDDGPDAIPNKSVFQAIFPVVYGAFQLATALSGLGDITLAAVSAEKIFKLIQYPSSINAVEMDQDTSKL